MNLLDDFIQVTNEHGWILYFPSRNLSDWDPKLIWYRSRIEHNDKIISLGFPKFYNLGEHEEDARRVREICNGKLLVEYSPKLDGSLIIRSVYDGHIIIRTRGCHTIGLSQECIDEIYKLINERMPQLLDPLFMPEYSLLFEYTSPINKIVVDYAAANLTSIGAIHHKFLRVLSASNLEAMHLSMQMEQAEYWNEDWLYNKVIRQEFASIHDLIEFVERETLGQEGIVVKIGNNLIKIKNAQYLKIHRMKFNLTDRVFFETCIKNELINKNDEQYLAKVFDADFETLPFLKERFIVFLQKLEDLQKFYNKVQEFLINAPTNTRKDFAFWSMEQKEFESGILLAFQYPNDKKLAAIYSTMLNLRLKPKECWNLIPGLKKAGLICVNGEAG